MSTTAADRSSGGFVVALWAAILLVVFTAFRSTDLLSLPSLLSGLGGGPLFGPEAVDSIVGVLAAGLLFLAWFGLGSLLNLFLRGERRPTDSHILEIAGTTAAGSAIWSIVWFFLGVAGFFDLVTAIGTAVVGVGLCVLGVMRLRAAKEESRTPEPASSSDRFFLILIAIALLIAFVAALAPPIAKDTLLYHFALPKAYIAQHSNAFVEGNIASYLALGGEMQFVWAMLLGGLYSLRAGETAAGAVAFLYLPLLLAAIFGWARELNVSRSWSLIAVLVVACIPTVFHSASSGYTDVALALYATLAVYSIFRWLETRETRTLIFFAIFIGGALAIKLTTLFLAAAFGARAAALGATRGRGREAHRHGDPGHCAWRRTRLAVVLKDLGRDGFAAFSFLSKRLERRSSGLGRRTFEPVPVDEFTVRRR
ncbi:MAG: hypothetical protein UZ17_ACD001002770 [Acidobacteria bacterium OLB17]|nr:MAG: hypothetical protein UZ17_ACD001002770 [Acidobacteria bacterium OLB17]